MHLALVACGVLGITGLVRRMRVRRPTPAQWLALAAFVAWSLGAGIDAGWSWFSVLGVVPEIWHAAVGWLRVVSVLAVALVVTTFGIRDRLRPAFMVGAVGAGALVCWLPGPGTVLGRRSEMAMLEWWALGLYLGYFAAVWLALLEVGRTRYRVGLPLPKQVQLRLLHAMATAGLTHVAAQAAVVVGLHTGWPGFTAAEATTVLGALLLVFALLFWLALAPPDLWLRMLAHIEATEVRAFATTFALQTKEDAAAGRDLGWRSELIAVAEQMAVEQGLEFDELAQVRLAAALLHTELEVRTPREPEAAKTPPRSAGDGSAQRLGVHPVVARTVWVPADVFEVLHDAESAAPCSRSARVLRVVDRYLWLRQSGRRDEASVTDSTWAVAMMDREFPGWDEVDALRTVVGRLS